jgi:hypothetical protein
MAAATPYSPSVMVFGCRDDRGLNLERRETEHAMLEQKRQWNLITFSESELKTRMHRGVKGDDKSQ